MKRVFVGLMVVILLAGCQPEVGETPVIIVETGKDNKPNDVTNQLEKTTAESEATTQTKASVTTTEAEETTVPAEEKAVGGWDMMANELSVTLPFNTMAYTAKAPSYNWKTDLSDLHNAGQYSGFTQGQLDMINKNGFVILAMWNYRVELTTFDTHVFVGQRRMSAARKY